MYTMGQPVHLSVRVLAGGAWMGSSASWNGGVCGGSGGARRKARFSEIMAGITGGVGGVMAGVQGALGREPWFRREVYRGDTSARGK